MPGRFGISFRKQPGRLFHFTLFAESASAGVKHELTGLRQHLLGFGLWLGIRLWLRFRMFEALQPGIHLLSAAVSPGRFGLVLAVRSSRRTGQSDVEMGGVSPPGTDLSQPGAIIIGMGLFAGIFLYRRAHKNALHPVVAGGIPEQGVGISVHVLVDAEQVVVNHGKCPGLFQLFFGKTLVVLQHSEPDIHIKSDLVTGMAALEGAAPGHAHVPHQDNPFFGQLIAVHFGSEIVDVADQDGMPVITFVLGTQHLIVGAFKLERHGSGDTAVAVAPDGPGDRSLQRSGKAPPGKSSCEQH